MDRYRFLKIWILHETPKNVICLTFMVNYSTRIRLIVLTCFTAKSGGSKTRRNDNLD